MNKIIPVLAVAISALTACSSNTKQTVVDTAKTTTQLITTDTIKLNQRWLGKWERLTHSEDATATISHLKGNVLNFSMLAMSGGHDGELEGKITIAGNRAVFTSSESKTCKLNLTLIGDSVIVINDNNSCESFGGMGVGFSGRFINSKHLTKAQQNGTNETMVSIKALTPREDSVFRTMVDATNYAQFVTTTQLTEQDVKDLDGLNAKVLPSGVRGMYTFMENIIMIDSAKHMWAALLDDNKVYYYTNQPNYKTKLAKTIEDWCSRFKDAPVIYKSK